MWKRACVSEWECESVSITIRLQQARQGERAGAEADGERKASQLWWKCCTFFSWGYITSRRGPGYVQVLLLFRVLSWAGFVSLASNSSHRRFVLIQVAKDLHLFLTQLLMYSEELTKPYPFIKEWIIENCSWPNRYLTEKSVINRYVKKLSVFFVFLPQISRAGGHHTDTWKENIRWREMPLCSPALQTPGMAGE